VCGLLEALDQNGAVVVSMKPTNLVRCRSVA
jgi:hypothetical protein